MKFSRTVRMSFWMLLALIAVRAHAEAIDLIMADKTRFERCTTFDHNRSDSKRHGHTPRRHTTG